MTIQDKTEMIEGKGYVLNLMMDNGLTKELLIQFPLIPHCPSPKGGWEW